MTQNIQFFNISIPILQLNILKYYLRIKSNIIKQIRLQTV